MEFTQVPAPTLIGAGFILGLIAFGVSFWGRSSRDIVHVVREVSRRRPLLVALAFVPAFVFYGSVGSLGLNGAAAVFACLTAGLAFAFGAAIFAPRFVSREASIVSTLSIEFLFFSGVLFAVRDWSVAQKLLVGFAIGATLGTCVIASVDTIIVDEAGGAISSALVTLIAYALLLVKPPDALIAQSSLIAWIVCWLGVALFCVAPVSRMVRLSSATRRWIALALLTASMIAVSFICLGASWLRFAAFVSLGLLGAGVVRLIPKTAEGSRVWHGVLFVGVLYLAILLGMHADVYALVPLSNGGEFPVNLGLAFGLVALGSAVARPHAIATAVIGGLTATIIFAVTYQVPLSLLNPLLLLGLIIGAGLASWLSTIVSGTPPFAVVGMIAFNLAFALTSLELFAGVLFSFVTVSFFRPPFKDAGGRATSLLRLTTLLGTISASVARDSSGASAWVACFFALIGLGFVYRSTWTRA